VLQEHTREYGGVGTRLLAGHWQLGWLLQESREYNRQQIIAGCLGKWGEVRGEATNAEVSKQHLWLLRIDCA
jgi:hypothetical protein